MPGALGHRRVADCQRRHLVVVDDGAHTHARTARRHRRVHRPGQRHRERLVPFRVPVVQHPHADRPCRAPGRNCQRVRHPRVVLPRPGRPVGGRVPHRHAGEARLAQRHRELRMPGALGHRRVADRQRRHLVVVDDGAHTHTRSARWHRRVHRPGQRHRERLVHFRVLVVQHPHPDHPRRASGGNGQGSARVRVILPRACRAVRRCVPHHHARVARIAQRHREVRRTAVLGYRHVVDAQGRSGSGAGAVAVVVVAAAVVAVVVAAVVVAAVVVAAVVVAAVVGAAVVTAAVAAAVVGAAVVTAAVAAAVAAAAAAAVIAAAAVVGAARADTHHHRAPPVHRAIGVVIPDLVRKGDGRGPGTVFFDVLFAPLLRPGHPKALPPVPVAAIERAVERRNQRQVPVPAARVPHAVDVNHHEPVLARRYVRNEYPVPVFVELESAVLVDLVRGRLLRQPHAVGDALSRCDRQ